MSRMLESELVRGLDRKLLRPFLTGASMMLPVIGLASLIQGAWIRPDLSLMALTLALGVLVRNTPAGRRLLDDSVSAIGDFLRRANQTLVIGLIQELMQFFKEVTRRFQQGLHLIEERLSHHLDESRGQLLVKSLLLPAWHFLESVIQFYVTVLVEPQVNPVKHFPLVTVAHKLMLPFLPLVTRVMSDLLDPLVPKWISIPFVTLTMLLLPGLAGFLVWELKENWKLYAANHASATPLGLADHRVEPAIVGSHGETMRGFLRRGFHSGTLPKAFDRLRGVIRREIRDEIENPLRLREAERHLTEIEQAICVFCDRELAYALRRRCEDPDCRLSRVQTRRPRLATSAFELILELETTEPATASPLELRLAIWLLEPELHLSAELKGPRLDLGDTCLGRIREDLLAFGERAGATRVTLNLG